jgi:hypothetical protein
MKPVLLILGYNPGMTNLNPISLDNDWRYYPTDDVDPTYGSSELDEASWGVLNTLATWPRDLLPRFDTLHLRHTFDLEPITDVCVRYVLHVEAAPEGTTVFINGWHVGTAQAGKALVSDVTDYVTLEGNVLLLKISKKGELRRLWLQAVPCEEH